MAEDKNMPIVHPQISADEANQILGRLQEALRALEYPEGQGTISVEEESRAGSSAVEQSSGQCRPAEQ